MPLFLRKYPFANVPVCSELALGADRLVDGLQRLQQRLGGFKRQAARTISEGLVRVGVEFEEDPVGTGRHG